MNKYFLVQVHLAFRGKSSGEVYTQTYKEVHYEPPTPKQANDFAQKCKQKINTSEWLENACIILIEVCEVLYTL